MSCPIAGFFALTPPKAREPRRRSALYPGRAVCLAVRAVFSRPEWIFWPSRRLKEKILVHTVFCFVLLFLYDFYVLFVFLCFLCFSVYWGVFCCCSVVFLSFPLFSGFFGAKNGCTNIFSFNRMMRNIAFSLVFKALAFYCFSTAPWRVARLLSNSADSTRALQSPTQCKPPRAHRGEGCIST